MRQPRHRVPKARAEPKQLHPGGVGSRAFAEEVKTDATQVLQIGDEAEPRPDAYTVAMKVPPLVHRQRLIRKDSEW